MNIFLVTAAHHMINVYEALEYFQLEKNNCCLYVMLNELEYAGLQQIIKSDKWSQVIFLPRWNNKRDSLFTYARKIRKFHEIITKQKEKYHEVKNFFYCQYNLDYSNHLVNVFKPDQVILMDEGNGAITYSNVRNTHLTSSYKGLNRKEKIKQNVFRLKMTIPEKLTFFTTYNLTKNNKDKYIQHFYESLKNRSRTMNRVDQSIILGAPLVELGILSKENYTGLLIKIQNLFPSKNLIYRAHRNEALESLNFIQDELKITVRHSSLPLEIDFLTKELPEDVISFYSSALHNINMVFQDAVHCYSIRFDLDLILNDSFKGPIGSVYSDYENKMNEHFTVIKV